MWLEPPEGSKIHLRLLSGKHTSQFSACRILSEGNRVLLQHFASPKGADDLHRCEGICVTFPAPAHSCKFQEKSDLWGGSWSCDGRTSYVLLWAEPSNTELLKTLATRIFFFSFFFSSFFFSFCIMTQPIKTTLLTRGRRGGSITAFLVFGKERWAPRLLWVGSL